MYFEVFFLNRSMLQFWSIFYTTQTSKHLKKFQIFEDLSGSKNVSKMIEFSYQNFFVVKILENLKKILWNDCITIIIADFLKKKIS